MENQESNKTPEVITNVDEHQEYPKAVNSRSNSHQRSRSSNNVFHSIQTENGTQNVTECYPNPKISILLLRKISHSKKGDKFCSSRRELFRSRGIKRRSRLRSKSQRSRSRSKRDRSHSRGIRDRYHSRGKRDRSHSRGKRDRSHSRGKRDRSHSRGKRDRCHSRGKRDRSHSRGKRNRSHSRGKTDRSRSRSKSYRSHSRSKVFNSIQNLHRTLQNSTKQDHCSHQRQERSHPRKTCQQFTMLENTSQNLNSDDQDVIFVTEDMLRNERCRCYIRKYDHNRLRGENSRSRSEGFCPTHEEQDVIFIKEIRPSSTKKRNRYRLKGRHLKPLKHHLRGRKHKWFRRSTSTSESSSSDSSDSSSFSSFSSFNSS